MYYAIIAEDVENSLPLRASARDAHLARLRELVAEGRDPRFLVPYAVRDIIVDSVCYRSQEPAVAGNLS